MRWGQGAIVSKQRLHCLQGGRESRQRFCSISIHPSPLEASPPDVVSHG